MHLKRLELLGFKSFASKTVLELDRGMTALVGPNGSGKSNVVDAIRWALGEQSLRAVRSRKSEEVIFSGNSRRSGVGMAEVSLVFDNSDGSLPLPFAEVSITRRLYRSSEGEYLINRARARLRDVVELLSHASLGPDAYAIVGQGAVDEVLLQRPEERRGLLEAAADVSRHQFKLRETLDKLAQTETNIRRVDDIRGEIAPRIPKLRAQANRALRHGEVVRRLGQMLQWRYLFQIRRAREQADADLELERSRARAAAESARAQDAARQRAARLMDRLREDESALEACRERLDALRGARARREREVALVREREAACRRQVAEVEGELVAARKERQELEAEVQKLAAARSGLLERDSSVRAEMGPAETERRQAISNQRLLQAQLERVSSEQQREARRRSELQGRRGALARDAQRVEEVRAGSLEAVRDATAQLAELEGQASIAQDELNRLQAELARVDSLHRDAQTRLQAVGDELEVARRGERECWERENDLRNRLSLLKSLKVGHQGISAGAKAILDAGLPGIRGTVASAIRVPPDYVTAVAAALGGAQGYVVSEGFREGLDALQLLAEHPGRATIAPLRLDRMQPARVLLDEFRSLLDGLLDGVAFRGLAADLVSCDADARDLCARYLGLSLVVESMADALELYRRLTQRVDGRLTFQVVTLDGRLLRARGDLSAGQPGGENGSLLAREVELLSLSESADRAQARLKEARAAVTTLESTRAELSREAAEALGATSSLRDQIGKRSAMCADLASQIARVEAAIEWHRSRAATAGTEATQSREMLTRTEMDLAEATARESDARERAEQLRGDLAAQQSLVAEIGARFSRFQSEASTVHGRLRELDARLSALSEAFGRAGSRVARQEERASQLAAELARLGQDAHDSFPASSVKEMEDAEKLASGLSARVGQAREGCASAESELAVLSRAQESAREELSRAQSRAQRTCIELAALLREAIRETDLELPEDAVSLDGDGNGAGPIGRFPGLVEAAGRVEEMLSASLSGASEDALPGTLELASRQADALRRELASLGTINADAPEEYRLVSERHSFLTAQLDDLRSAERTLEKAIEELRRVMRVRFQETFDTVNAEFGRCFSALFGGGTARLVLTQPDQPLEGGVEVVASPPGRRGGSLLSLSGGERALTTVALLFALMRVKPSPFCLLDEVDAALDESNVQRFCGMVRELTSNTQFLMITHNRTTMEMANALYGVSMTPDSISRVVSMRLASEES